MNSTENVLEQIEKARLNGDFELVKRLSKEALEDPQSDIPDLLIMSEIAHMYLDGFLVWVNEIRKKSGGVDFYRAIDQLLKEDSISAEDYNYLKWVVDKHDVLRGIAQDLEDHRDELVWYTPYMREMGEASPEKVREDFLSTDGDVEAAKETKEAKEARKDDCESQKTSASEFRKPEREGRYHPPKLMTVERIVNIFAKIAEFF